MYVRDLSALWTRSPDHGDLGQLWAKPFWEQIWLSGGTNFSCPGNKSAKTIIWGLLQSLRVIFKRGWYSVDSDNISKVPGDISNEFCDWLSLPSECIYVFLALAQLYKCQVDLGKWDIWTAYPLVALMSCSLNCTEFLGPPCTLSRITLSCEGVLRK